MILAILFAENPKSTPLEGDAKTFDARPRRSRRQRAIKAAEAGAAGPILETADGFRITDNPFIDLSMYGG
jgi:hypothetical protein